ncbi:MAG: hypothetical protein IRZ09_04940 [Variibacter sp.]|nr:hypothetical protein [Variibacter sp.]
MKLDEEETIRRLIGRYGRSATLGEILEKTAEPKRRGRPKKYNDVLMAALGWLAVERERDNGPAGRRLTIEKACRNLAEKARRYFEGIPGWQVLRKHHDRAEAIARNVDWYRKMLDEGLAESRAMKVEFAYPLPGPNPDEPTLFEIIPFDQAAQELIDAWHRGLRGAEFHGKEFRDDEFTRELRDAYRRAMNPDGN